MNLWKQKLSNVWNGTDDSESSVASGIYLYRMSTDKFSETRKIAACQITEISKICLKYSLKKEK